MAGEVLSQRALNRAMLSRQLMLDQAGLPEDPGPRRAARPDPEVPAPVRLAAEFDNLLLAHADRTRLISAANLKRFYTINGVFPGSVLVDGLVAGMWRLARSKGSATLAIDLFGPVPPADRDLVAREGARMLAFCAPDAAREIRFSTA